MKSINIFEFTSYKEYTLERVRAMPRGGHGQFIKIARHIRVNPVIITQVLKGDRNFSDEQGLQLTNYLGLMAIEVEFFMRLLALEKAGTTELKSFHRKALNDIRKQAQDARNRIGAFKELDDTAKSVFYSDWTYSAVRMLTFIPQYRSLDAIAERLDLNRNRVNEILEFLLETGLCKRTPEGSIEPGVSVTFMDVHSRFTTNSLRNWRLKGIERLNRRTPEDFFYSFPCTVAAKDIAAVKETLVSTIGDLTKRASDAESEVFACLNIDWFQG